MCSCSFVTLGRRLRTSKKFVVDATGVASSGLDTDESTSSSRVTHPEEPAELRFREIGRTSLFRLHHPEFRRQVARTSYTSRVNFAAGPWRRLQGTSVEHVLVCSITPACTQWQACWYTVAHERRSLSTYRH